MTNSLTTKPTFKTKIVPRKSNKYKNFILAFLSTISLSMLTIGLFNYLIDPYGVFNAFYLPKFNDVKPKKDNNDRLYRAIDIIKIKPRSLIVGSSRVKYSMNPDHPLITNNYQEPVYNLGMNSPNMYEVRKYLDHAFVNQSDIDLVILGIDFFMFNDDKINQQTFNKNRLGRKQIMLGDGINSLLSFDAIEASLKTIQNSQEKDIEKNYGNKGFYPFNSSYFKLIMPLYELKTKKDDFILNLNNYFKFYKNHSSFSKNIQNFQQIVNLCQDKNIKIVAFITPAHATDSESIRLAGQWKNFENWKREIVKITPIYDFSGYNTITTENIYDGMENYYESSHFTEKVGDIILERILSNNSANVPTDFGILITSENIESHLAKIRQDREIWKKNHTQDWQLVETIRQQQESSLQPN